MTVVVATMPSGFLTGLAGLVYFLFKICSEHFQLSRKTILQFFFFHFMLYESYLLAKHKKMI